MKYYNVYSDASFSIFSSRQEADYIDDIAWWSGAGPAKQLITRCGCYPQETFEALSQEREQIFNMWQEAKDTNPQFASTLWTAYSRFWFEHRNV